MADRFLLWLVLLPIGLTGATIFALERLLSPGTLVFWRRQWAANAMHAGICLLVFTFELAVFQRPYLAGIIVSAFFLSLVLVNNAKFHSLREPFIFQDFDYFWDALKHPRLYLPFLGLGKTLAGIIVIVLSLSTGLWIEESILQQISVSQFTLVLLGQAGCGLLFFCLGSRQKMLITLTPEVDLFRMGMLASLCRYREEEREPVMLDAIRNAASVFNVYQTVTFIPTILPNLLVVQSESFFDARRLFDGIRPEVLQHFDAIQAVSSLSGQLTVPAWGANTVRTEFSFLSALNGSDLGIHRFNPYRKLVNTGFPTIANYLKNLGYRTICVHPYPANFYQRDTVYPKLGFDEFFDISSFSEIDEDQSLTHYVSDADLAKKVCELLDPTSSQPLFVFVITMENHGPLHLEKMLPEDSAHLYTTAPPSRCENLSIYLRHLSNADRMAKILHEHLMSLPRPGWFCWYGDHVPIMPNVYAAFGTPDGRTDYFIRGHDLGMNQRLDIGVDQLGPLLLRKMNLLPPMDV